MSPIGIFLSTSNAAKPSFSILTWYGSVASFRMVEYFPFLSDFSVSLKFVRLGVVTRIVTPSRG